MDKLHIKIIAVIIAFSVTITFIIGYVAINRSSSLLTAEIEEKILSTAENFSNDFSAEFNHMEGLTDSLAAYVSTSFDAGDYYADPDGYLEAYKEDLADIIKTNLMTVNKTHSLYVTFNPELTSGSDEVWYAVVDGRATEIQVDFEKNKRDFEIPYKEDMAYFFEPQGKTEGVWIKPYYDKDIQQEIFSYSRAIYVDDIFVGVAGADITAEDTIKVIEEMELYSGGYSALLDDEYQFIIMPEQVSADEEKVVQDKLGKKLAQDKDAESGIIKYNFEDHERIIGYSMMDNGWIMTLVQPQSEAYRPITMMTNVMKALGIVLAIVLMLFLAAFAAPFIRKQHYLEEENREKDIMLMYQSRQAKIGEMVGNIAHQWKQPLNTINLIMANLLDSYRYDDLDEERLSKSVNKVSGITNKMSETISDFSGFLKPTKEKEAFDVTGCIRTALSLMEESISIHRIKVDVSCQTESRAFGYYNETVHVIFNILNNARDAIVMSEAEEKTIKIIISKTFNMINVSIVNYGEHIPPEVKEHIFEPYYTTKEAKGGTGLGLYISKQIVEVRMNGRIFIDNIPEGVLCGILIPAEEEEEKNGH